jgi:hypothetical protein
MMTFNNHENLGSSLTGKSMTTYDSQYNYGRFSASDLNNEGASLLPKRDQVSAAKPEAVTHSRPLAALSPKSMQILAGLPSSFQMHETRKTYPHVMNMIADSWHDPEFFFHAVRNLLLDQRGGRAGFQFSVLAEITNLREYYFSTVRPEAGAKFNRDI